MPNNDATEHGHTHEDIAAQEFANKYGKFLFKFSSIPWSENSKISASVDTVDSDGNNVEIKCPLYDVVTERWKFRIYETKISLLLAPNSTSNAYFKFRILLILLDMVVHQIKTMVVIN